MDKYIYDGYVLNPSAELKPSIRVSPFATRYIPINRSLYLDPAVGRNELLRKHIGSEFLVVSSGRIALETVLTHYGLSRADNVWIITTSGNMYISGCVTKAIEKYCSWSRAYTENTKVIFVNHEFGYPFSNWEIKKYNLPIIEDVAHSFFSSDAGGTTTNTGDFTIYSIPKYFPIPFGGLVKINTKAMLQSNLSAEEGFYVQKLVNHYLEESESFKSKRLHNYHYLEEALSQLNCTPFFPLTPKVIPGAFLFRTPESVDLDLLKIRMQAGGIECSVFYGEKAFFIPINQNLQKSDLDYMISLLKLFIV